MNKKKVVLFISKIADSAYRCIKYLYIIMILSIIISCVFFANIRFGRDTFCEAYLPALILIPMGIVFIFGSITLLEKCSCQRKYLKYISLIVFILQIYSIWNYYFYTDWDSSVLISFASALVHKEDISWMPEYFSKYPNNLFLGLVFYNIEEITHDIGLHSMEYFSIILFQCIIVTITGVLIFKILNQLLNKIILAYLGYILYIALIGISPWVSIPYSDSIGVLFPTLIYYLYINCKNTSKKDIVWLMIAVLSIIGYKIKPQIFIVFIAIFINEILLFIKTKRIHLKSVIGVILGIVLAELFTCFYISRAPIVLNENQSFGIQHYFMMGMNPDSMGVYSEDDVQFSASFSNIKERNTADMIRAAERIKQMGTFGVLKQCIRKTLTNYYDGTFCWAGEGDFFKNVLEEKKLPGCKLLRGLYYTRNYSDVGKYYSVWSNFEQMLWLTIILLNFISAFAPKDMSTNVLMLGIIGLTLFELLFEARARYLFTYVPLYVILAIYGINFINKKRDCKDSVV